MKTTATIAGSRSIPTSWTDRISSISPGVARLAGLTSIMIVGVADHLTGPTTSFAVFYLIPIAFVSWLGGWSYGLLCAIVGTLIRTLDDVFWLPDVSTGIHLWNMLGRLINFVAIAWMLDYIRKSYTERLQHVENRYSRIVETAAEGIITTDSEGRVKFANTHAEQLLGKPAAALMGTSVFDLMDAEARSRLLSFLKKNKAPGRQFEVPFTREGGDQRWALCSVGILQEKNTTQEMVLFLTDISERKKAEEQLRHHYQEISAMQLLSSVLAQTLNLDKRLEKAVETVLAVTQFKGGAIYLVDETEGDLALRHHLGLPDQLAGMIARWPLNKGFTGQAATTGTLYIVSDAFQEDGFNDQVRKLGNIRGFASIPLISKERVLGVLNIFHHQPHAFSKEEQLVLQTFGRQIGIAVENSRLYETTRESERQVRQLSIDLVQVQEEERKRFARELHDGLSQVLTTLKINSELALRKYESSDQGGKDHLLEVIQLSDEAQTEAKEIAYDLRPSILDDFGLTAAIPQHTARFERRTGISVELHLPHSGRRFNSLIETTVYRILQELLTNVAKHSGASRVVVQLLERDGTLAMNVADNGKGFKTNSTNTAGKPVMRSGLRNLRERVEFLGGTFRAESVSGQGTEFMIELPLHAADIRQPKIERTT